MQIDEAGALHLHQSDIEAFMQCPEKARLGVVGNTQFESDAATVGSGLHATIENELMYGERTLYQLQLFATDWLGNTLKCFAFDGATYSRETFKTDAKAMASLEVLVEGWFRSKEREMLLMMDPADYSVEVGFDLPFIHDANGRQVYLAGRCDLVMRSGVWDWKSSSGEYKPWERQRWAVQPTVYTWAMSQRGLIVPDDRGRFKFSYKVLVRRQEPKAFQTVDCYRGAGQFKWLAKIADNMSTFITRNGFEEPWPLNDHSALCSPKWCPFWGECKGSLVTEEWT